MKTKHDTNRKGAALFTVMMIIMAVTALLTISVRASVQQIFMARKLAERIKASAIAEAGANHAYHILATNFAARTSDDAFPLTTFADGTFDVTVTPVGGNVAVISSMGIFGSATENVVLDIKNYGTSSSVEYPTNSFAFSVLAGGKITWTGASELIGSGLHSNDQFTRSGNGEIDGDVSSSLGFHSQGSAGGIDGDVTAPVLSGNLSGITGTANAQAVPLVQIPDIDLTPYYNRALANGEVRSGNVTLSSVYTPAGGILWVNGDLTISGNGTFNGSYIATGNVSVSGGGAINNDNPYPTLVSRDGDMSFTGDKDVQGLIYVKNGDYKQTGGNELTGQIIVKGDVDKGGGSMVISYGDSTPTPPDGESSATDVIGLSAWQK